MLACREEFENNHLAEASVASIVSRLGIARGSFYKYFKDLEECYFYLLSRETSEAHELFIEIMRKTGFDLIESLKQYGEVIANEIHNDRVYYLYRNRYMDWTPMLQKKWQSYCKEANVDTMRMEDFVPNMPTRDRGFVGTMQIIKAVVHNLIEQNFLEDWTRDDFIKNYNLQVSLLIDGLKMSFGR